jgi:ABC-type nitrate/sulfonate/bicarbonate transport system substrate-binding protein
MKRKYVAGIMIAGVLVVVTMMGGVTHGAESEQNNVPVRIGWQIPTATQGQIVEVLKRTDLLEQHGLEPTFVPFSYGGPQTDAALAGKLDIMFSGDQPAINLIARGGKWKIIGRLYYDRVAIIVPMNSPVKEVKDLVGKTVASPFGSIAHREAIIKEQAAGLNADNDVKNVNRDIFDIRKLVLAGENEMWGELDAVTVWEPNTSRFEIERLARSLSSDRALGVVSISEDFIVSHPDATVQCLVALARAWEYFSRYSEKVNQWYIDDSLLGYTQETLNSAAQLDPNFGLKTFSEMSFQLNEDDIIILEQGALWAQERGYSKILAPVRQAVDQSLLASAKQALVGTQFRDPQIIMPSARETTLGMKTSGYALDRLPVWAFFFLMIVLTLVSIEAGQWLGTRRRRLAEHESENAVGAVAGAVLGLLAFVIAIVFGSASGRFDASKEALLDDVNAIYTVYARAGLVPEPHRTETRALVRDYVEVRINMADVYENPEQLKALRVRAIEITKMLWSHAETLAAIEKNDIYSLFSESLTELLNVQVRRIAFGAQFRMPLFVWYVMGLTSCISMFVVGFQFGLSGKRSFPAQLALALTFALVLQLIYDMDRPGQGMIRINQQPMRDLYQSISVQK